MLKLSRLFSVSVLTVTASVTFALPATVAVGAKAKPTSAWESCQMNPGAGQGCRGITADKTAVTKVVAVPKRQCEINPGAGQGCRGL